MRAFSWAPALPSPRSHGTLGTRLCFGQHIVAVSNDDNMLAFVVVKSPTTTYGAEKRWHAEVLTHVSTTPKSESIFSKPCSFEDLMKQQRHISHVSWSPWVQRGDCCHSVIVYATNEDVRARAITYTHDNVELGDEILYSGIEMRFNGPMKWSPVVDANVLSLALFSSSGLVHLSVSAIDASIIKEISHDLDGRWDQVSGAIWDPATHSTPQLHFSSLLSTIQSPTAVLEVSPHQLKALEFPSWRDQIVNSAVLFSARNDLKGNTKMKVWGLATAPLSDFIATCHSVHPSDMIEYGSPNDRRGTVAISGLRQYRQIRKCFPARDVSAEGVLFTLKKLMENTVEDTEQMPAFVDEMVEKLARAYSSIAGSGDTQNFPSATLHLLGLDALVKAFKRIAFFDSESMKDRYKVLVSQACDLMRSCDLQRTLIAYRLATALQDLPASLSETSFSADIRTHHVKIVSLIQAITQDEFEQPHLSHAGLSDSAEDQADSVAIALPKIANDDSEAASLDLAAFTTDRCDFCAAPVPLTDVFTATCTNGHQFPRCGISFLAIQAPGITKYCGICSTPFLSEEFVLAQEMARVVRRVKDNDDADLLVGSSEGMSFKQAQAQVQAQAQANRIGIPQVHNQGEAAQESGTSDQVDDQHSGTRLVEAIDEPREEVVVNEGRKESPVTLARVLFLACDACIYCGGKFVG